MVNRIECKSGSGLMQSDFMIQGYLLGIDGPEVSFREGDLDVLLSVACEKSFCSEKHVERCLIPAFDEVMILTVIMLIRLHVKRSCRLIGAPEQLSTRGEIISHSCELLKLDFPVLRSLK